MATQAARVTKTQAPQPYFFKQDQETILTNALDGIHQVIANTEHKHRKTAAETISGRVQVILEAAHDNKVVPIAGKKLVEPAKKPPLKFEREVPKEDEVNVKFDESHFNQITESLTRLFKTFNTLEVDVNQKISEISGITAVLAQAASDYETQKTKGIALLQHYPIFFNSAIDIIQTIIGKDGREAYIKNLCDTSSATIGSFIEANNKRITFFSALFKDIATQHQLLKETLDTGGTYKTTKLGWGSSMIGGILGSTPNVKEPNAQDPSYRYKKEASPLESSTPLDQTIINPIQKKPYSETDFTVLFQENNQFLTNTLKFSRAARKHLGDVVQTKHTLIPTDPEFEQRKKEAGDLPEKYEHLHDQCQKAYEKFNEFNKEAQILKGKLQSHLNTKLKELQDKKAHLITLFSNYANTSKALDQKIHSKLEMTKDMRLLTSDITADKKYPI